LKDVFGTLLVNYKNNSNSKEELIDSLAPSFFILVESFIIELLAISYTIPYIKTLVDDFNN